MLIIQEDGYSDSRLATVIVISMTSKLNAASNPGNVLVRKSESGLDRDSVINVTQISTIDKLCLLEQVGNVSESIMDEIMYGLTLVLGIG